MSVQRLDPPYENRSKSFYRTDHGFQKQYFHIYESRLRQLGSLIKVLASDKYGKKYEIKKISELREDGPKTCILVGTLFKNMMLKPSILKEIAEENQLAPMPPPQDYNDATDDIILEDEIQRIKLVGNINIGDLVTGIVVGVLGYVQGAGTFHVKDMLFYECGPEKPLKTIDYSPLIVFISGIDMGNIDPPILALDLFEQWLYGNLEIYNSQFDPKNVVRVIIAGNSTNSAPPKKPKNKNATNLRAIDTRGMIESIRTFDEFLSSLSKSVSVDLMPGQFDPSNIMLPQQPFHHGIFPKSSINRALTNVPNPYKLSIEDRVILGTSGQNIKDIRKFSTQDDPIDALKSTLKWSHLAPTCPDTLSCFPFYDEDPFVITECPHVYFCAQDTPFMQTEFYENSNGQKTRLICIPSFQKSQTVAVLNLNNLDCEEITFQTKMDVDEE